MRLDYEIWRDEIAQGPSTSLADYARIVGVQALAAFVIGFAVYAVVTLAGWW